MENTTRNKLSLCALCGGRSVALADGRPLCAACLKELLARMDGSPTVTDLGGAPLALDLCPACGTLREPAVASGYLGCPACYAAFGLAAG